MARADPRLNPFTVGCSEIRGSSTPAVGFGLGRDHLSRPTSIPASILKIPLPAEPLTSLHILPRESEGDSEEAVYD